MSTVSLILGGIRSGKSAYAEQFTERMARGQMVLYVATGVAVDDEMAERIRRHQDRRPPHWFTLEAPLNPTGALQSAMTQTGSGPDDPPAALLLDSVDAWVSNLLFEHENAAPAELEARCVGAARRFVAVVRELGIDAVLVSSEVGNSLVATSALGRRFQDLLGTVNQAVAVAADAVTLVTAGIPVTIKTAARA